MLEVLLNLPRGLPEAFVFPNPNTGVPYSKTRLEVIFMEARKATGINLWMYAAGRHSVLSQAGMAGVSPSDEYPLNRDPALPFLSITADGRHPKVNPGCPGSRETFTDLVSDGIGRDKEEFFY